MAVFRKDVSRALVCLPVLGSKTLVVDKMEATLSEVLGAEVPSAAASFDDLISVNFLKRISLSDILERPQERLESLVGVGRNESTKATVGRSIAMTAMDKTNSDSITGGFMAEQQELEIRPLLYCTQRARRVLFVATVVCHLL
jgi:hypothetical protein